MNQLAWTDEKILLNPEKIDCTGIRNPHPCALLQEPSKHVSGDDFSLFHNFCNACKMEFMPFTHDYQHKVSKMSFRVKKHLSADQSSLEQPQPIQAASCRFVVEQILQ